MFALTVPFAVTVFVYTVSLLLLHPLGVLIASLAVNVNVKFPLVHAACVMLHVGPTVSIQLTFTVTTFVLFSLSFIVILQLSVPLFPLFGVYVITFPFIAHVHFVAAVVTVAVNAPLPQFHSVALLNTFQSPVFAVFHTLLLNVKLSDAVGATLLTVHVALFAVTFPTPSFTYHVFVPLFGCVHPVLNVHVVVLFHVLPSKLYADELGIHPHPVPSLALVILKLHAVHSFTV